MDNKAKILDIAMNLNRIGNWAADSYSTKQKRILMFLNQTTMDLKLLKSSSFPNQFKKTFKQFSKEYSRLEKAAKSKPKDELKWAEEMMTWGNILTHRTKLL